MSESKTGRHNACLVHISNTDIVIQTTHRTENAFHCGPDTTGTPGYANDHPRCMAPIKRWEKITLIKIIGIEWPTTGGTVRSVPYALIAYAYRNNTAVVETLAKP